VNSLSVSNLRVEIAQPGATVTPVDNVSFAVARGEVLGIAGESGSGKSLTLKALVGLTPHQSQVSGVLQVDLDGRGLTPYRPDRVRGRGISMVFQDPMTALNPTMRVGDQVAIGLRARQSVSRTIAGRQAAELLGSLGVPDPARRARMWPHELSGGMRQRVMIAMALSTDPRILLCDEPTTALDVSVQDQVLALLLRVREDHQLSIVFVSHDLAVLHQICDRLLVLYAGRVMETGPVDAVVAAPTHPYTAALVESMPSMAYRTARLASIPGQPPDPTGLPAGCRFAPRCPHAVDVCATAGHMLVPSSTHQLSACVRASEIRVAR
jgi:oligopeptide/dipeptide ABC transporter ATP-binding protein